MNKILSVRKWCAERKHIRFIDGFSLFEDDELWADTVDTCHPNDLGFYWFYRKLKPVLADLIL